MPLDTTHPVHPDWAAHYQPVSQRTMNATVTVTDGTTGGGWDPVTGPIPDAPVVVYTGKARVAYKPVRAEDRDAAGQRVTVRDVTVAVDRDACPELATTARVKVTAVDANGPAALAGRTLAVQSTAWPSHALEQVITCTDDQTNQGA
ncbi:hypothetical protein Xcel_0533 [Xylanimonas cellulosilytica DSM 15894]|uniref:Uncharacterized protein n=1 Tax=Xylanimonas cellulosilytica (strain DSM 15894 / JCM 12276 / CECT 5975 / KCTC 9989 / LMG 20990 / NBRC 107835 / XIL07) TaxID=446471 RepID=D1BW69_XYLCX|nr:DUF6093 family protein [Xylanimonas cellulosilytica]ACZ29572.1 hypothetical protein Xcel_0533 [Xylanimonas cellulosilytica DSM 15894]